MNDFAHRLLGRPDAAPVRPLLPSRFEPATPLRHEPRPVAQEPTRIELEAPPEPAAPPEPGAPPMEQPAAESAEAAPGKRRPAERRPSEKQPSEMAPAHQPSPLQTPRSGEAGAQPHPTAPGKRESHPIAPGKWESHSAALGERESRPIALGERESRPAAPGERESRLAAPGKREPRPAGLADSMDSTLRPSFPVANPHLPAASADSPSAAMPREAQPRRAEGNPARRPDPATPSHQAAQRPEGPLQDTGRPEGVLQDIGRQDWTAARPDPPAAASGPLPHPTRAHAVATPAPQAWLPTPDRAPEAEPVVHITIGRVEVRAAAESAPVPRSPRRRQALGLDEYLRRKAGGR